MDSFSTILDFFAPAAPESSHPAQDVPIDAETTGSGNSGSGCIVA